MYNMYHDLLFGSTAHRMAFLRDGRSAGTTKLGLLMDLDSHKLVTVETTYLGGSCCFMRGPHETVLVRWLSTFDFGLGPAAGFSHFASTSRHSDMVRAPLSQDWLHVGKRHRAVGEFELRRGCFSWIHCGGVRG